MIFYIIIMLNEGQFDIWLDKKNKKIIHKQNILEAKNKKIASNSFFMYKSQFSI